MRSIRPEVTNRGDNQLEPLAVSPRQACLLLGVGNTHLYQLIGNGELQSYLDGRARRITMESIRRRVARLLSAAGASDAASHRGHQRPRQIDTRQKTGSR
jgi:excisionase family DNA binding protein